MKAAESTTSSENVISRGGGTELEQMLVWVDSIPLSRPRRHLARDFSDAVLLAEVIRHYRPRLVTMHSYCPAASVAHKRQNWAHLQRTALSKLGIAVPERLLTEIMNAKTGAIEQILIQVRTKLCPTHCHPHNGQYSPAEGMMGQCESAMTDNPWPNNMSDTDQTTHCCRYNSNSSTDIDYNYDATQSSAAEMTDMRRQLALQNEEISVLRARVARLEKIAEFNSCQMPR